MGPENVDQQTLANRVKVQSYIALAMSKYYSVFLLYNFPGIVV